MANTRKPSNKRKPTATAATPTDITIIHSPSNSDDTLDTATSQPQEPDEEVNIDDRVVISELSEYEFRNGFNPVKDYAHMQRFCFPYIHMGVGNNGGWEAKIQHLNYKFKYKSVEFVAKGQVKEFLLWKKMFARKPPCDEESRTS